MSRPIIPRPDTSVVNAYDYKYPAGKMNPVEKRIITRNVCIDSLFRKNYSKTKSNNFLVTLPEPINNVVSMSVASIEFPNCWYTFDSKNKSNEFTITLYNVPTPSDVASPYPPVIVHKIVIPDGNYRSDVFRDSMNNMFSNLRNGLEFLYFDVNENTAKCVIRSKALGDDSMNIFKDADILTLDPTNSFYFTVDFSITNEPDRPLYLNAGWMMGFRDSSYTIGYNASPHVDILSAPFIAGSASAKEYHWYLEGESSYGSNVQNYIYLEIDDFHRNFVTNSVVANSIDGNYLGNNVMGRISVVSGMYTTITNTASDKIFKKREFFGPTKLEKINVRLLNKYGEPIEMNENDFSFALEIEQIYS